MPSKASKRILNMCALNRLLAFSLLVLLTADLTTGEQPAGEQEAIRRAIQDTYNKHNAAIHGALPPYSGPPLLLDLYQKSLEDGLCDPQQHAAWEDRFDGIMGSPAIADLGFSKPSEATATTLVTVDTFGRIYSLPAKQSFAVVTAKPIAGKVCVAQSRRYVYSKLTLDVLKEFKTAKHSNQQPQAGAWIAAVEFGGSVRFPSGYLETFLLSQEGFVDIGKQYVLFMWKPVPSDDTLVISQAYLIQDGFVFPVSTDGDAQTVYTKTPFAEFESKVKAAVARNIDVDVLPHVHAAKRRLEGVAKAK